MKATASLGIASTEAFGYELDTLMRRADMAVYAAKRAGRNRVVVATAVDADAGVVMPLRAAGSRGAAMIRSLRTAIRGGGEGDGSGDARRL